MATHEEPIDILNTPYQHLQPLIIQAAARARTRAAWYHKRDHGTRLLPEIDKQASTINRKLSNEHKGILRTHISGGGIAKQDIAKYNEDINEVCDYCQANTSTANHTIWSCSFFLQIRRDTDPELAKSPYQIPG